MESDDGCPEDEISIFKLNCLQICFLYIMKQRRTYEIRKLRYI